MSVDNDRRTLIRTALAGTAALGAGALSLAGATTASAGETAATRATDPHSVWHALLEGNRRWRTYHQLHPHEDQQIRTTLVSGQHPIAAVLSCVDSRVPPELVFDQGLGDLLTTRTAGQVLDEAVLGSAVYGPVELGIRLLVVLGHSRCGAVTAAVESDESGVPLPGHLAYLGEQIRPAIDHSLHGDARVDAAITTNVRLIVNALRADADLAGLVNRGELVVVGARYELDTGRVHQVA
ncbi:carbonic anhydrase [Allostreptomyces psammosilenae]|uniref:Carbonic anhydrase n=1 Tax=Allostreptomyces psammosilenae TaxID=1892865 RepID=A0A853A176_9ACTN|nr:carbonic anhydrase [Allostreptomyces psammosilenae]NYI08316.1 carbonic anhydrase [Allostreptomyces psammosilenae]